MLATQCGFKQFHQPIELLVEARHVARGRALCDERRIAACMVATGQPTSLPAPTDAQKPGMRSTG
jgi:hypothetical protein